MSKALDGDLMIAKLSFDTFLAAVRRFKRKLKPTISAFVGEILLRLIASVNATLQLRELAVDALASLA